MRYVFDAVTANGDPASGAVEAATRSAAIELLHRRGLAPFRVERDGAERTRFNIQGWQARHLGVMQKGYLLRQLGALMEAGITIDRALLLAHLGFAGGTSQVWLEKVHASVTSGQPLSRSLAGSEAGFTAAEIGIIRAGEQSGNLAAVLDELAAHLEREYQARARLVSTLIYPAFLLCLAPVSLLIIALVLVPNIAPLFEHSEATMPLALQAMVFVTDEINERGMLWSALVCLLIICGLWAGTRPGLRRGFRETAAATPLIKSLVLRRELALLSFTLSSLLSGGMPLQAALAHALEAADQPSSRKGLAKSLDMISAGAKLAEALQNIPAFDKSALQLVAAGEESNRLADMLKLIGASAESAAQRSVERFTTLLTPLLTTAIGLLVGGVVMSVMQAILSINEVAVR